MNYYNEIEPSAIAWLKELIKAGEIPDGHIDTRSIADVRPEDLAGFNQCHFFAGIAGWPLALRLAGYADTPGLWTGSCPCQPFSAAGKRKGTSDARHLWPEMRRLVEQCRPAIVLGEQVASKDGRTWCAGVRADMEALGYAFGAADLCAAGVGAPHIRQRLYWGGCRRMEKPKSNGGHGPVFAVQRGEVSGPVDASSDGGCGGVEYPTSEQVGIPGQPREQRDADGLGDPDDPRPQGHGIVGERPRELSPWSASTLIHCADGKTRRICPESQFQHVVDGLPHVMEYMRASGIAEKEINLTMFPLAANVVGRVGLLRGYGNAIVPQLAEAFITSFMEAITDAR